MLYYLHSNSQSILPKISWWPENTSHLPGSSQPDWWSPTQYSYDILVISLQWVVYLLHLLYSTCDVYVVKCWCNYLQKDTLFETILVCNAELKRSNKNVLSYKESMLHCSQWTHPCTNVVPTSWAANTKFHCTMISIHLCVHLILYHNFKVIQTFTVHRRLVGFIGDGALFYGNIGWMSQLQSPASQIFHIFARYPRLFC